mgnify:CR=1 FL=1
MDGVLKTDTASDLVQKAKINGYLKKHLDSEQIKQRIKND